jgi:hypothetical protein
MPTTSYVTKPAVNADELGSDVLVVHCSDPRFQPHFQDFLHGGLGLDRYALLAVPGGAHCLTLTDYLPKYAWAQWHWLKFLGDLLRPRRVVLIGHDDCRWYQDGRFQHQHAGSDDHQHGDLARVRMAIAERLPGVPIETWFARLDGDRATFARESSA